MAKSISQRWLGHADRKTRRKEAPQLGSLALTIIVEQFAAESRSIFGAIKLSTPSKTTIVCICYQRVDMLTKTTGQRNIEYILNRQDTSKDFQRERSKPGKGQRSENHRSCGLYHSVPRHQQHRQPPLAFHLEKICFAASGSTVSPSTGTSATGSCNIITALQKRL